MMSPERLARCRGTCTRAQADQCQPRVRAKLEFGARERLKGPIAHDQHDDFGLFEAGLQAEGSRTHGVEGRVAPHAGVVGHHDAVSAFGAEYEPAFDQATGTTKTALASVIMLRARSKAGSTFMCSIVRAERSSNIRLLGGDCRPAYW